MSNIKSDQSVSFSIPSPPKEYIKFPENIKSFPEKIIYIGELEMSGKLSKWDSFFNMQVLCRSEVNRDSIDVCKSSRKFEVISASDSEDK